MIHIAEVPGGALLAATLRSDLAPIPLSLEATIAILQEGQAMPQDGATWKVNGLDYTIVKHGPQRGGHFISGKRPARVVPVIAFPSVLAGLAQQRRSAVIRRGANLSEIYRACGASAPVSGDIAIGSFAALRGEVPTFMLTRVLQEEGACLFWRGRGVTVARLPDLALRPPEHSLDAVQMEKVQSRLLEKDDIPLYISCDAHGNTISGIQRTAAQGAPPCVQFSPRKSPRELNQMSRVLVLRGTLRIQPHLGIAAGQVVAVEGKHYIVMTAAHVLQNAADGAGSNQYTRLWLGEVV